MFNFSMIISLLLDSLKSINSLNRIFKHSYLNFKLTRYTKLPDNHNNTSVGRCLAK